MKFLLMREILQENEEMGLWVWRLKSIKEGKFEEIGDGKRRRKVRRKRELEKEEKKQTQQGVEHYLGFIILFWWMWMSMWCVTFIIGGV